MQKSLVLSFAEAARSAKSRFGFNFTAETVARMTKADLAAIGAAEVRKIAEVKNAFIGRNYERVCHAHGADADFHAEKPSGMHWASEALVDILLQSDKDESKYYLRISFDGMTRTATRYLVDGKPATEAQDSAIRACLAAKVKPSAKQAAHGVDMAREVIVRSYGTDSITSLDYGATGTHLAAETAEA